jgi:hypothetical protein
MIPPEDAIPKREPITRWLLLWQLYGLPRCSQASYPESAPHCNRLIWPWQPREVRNGSPVHVACQEQGETG